MQNHPKPGNRHRLLDEIRAEKLARSSHAFVRGSTRMFYEWLASHGKKIPKGPLIWICGDAHAGNFGPIANAKGGIDIQVRDFDQTVIGNPAYDLIRLGLSLASAARGSDLSGIVTVRMLEDVTTGYINVFKAFERDQDSKLDWPKSVKTAFRAAVDGTWKTMAKQNIEDTSPSIPLGRRFWRLSKSEKKEIKELFRRDKVRRLVTSLRRRDDDSPVAVHDTAFWVKGCSSLGNLRYAVLLGIGKKHPEYCIVDIKEAVKPIAPKPSGANIPSDDAERVAAGAWHMSPALGTRILATSLQGRSVFLRELLPQDLKFEIEDLEQNEALRVARFLGSIIGKAHARQMDAKMRKAWLTQLGKGGGGGVPDWLWSSVTRLLVLHEDAYLKHCRVVTERMPE